MQTSQIELDFPPIGKVPIFLRSWGEETKETIVLVHGWMHTSRIWCSLAEHLESRYSLLALDLPGFGDTPPLPTQNITLEDYAGILKNFINHIASSRKLHGAVGHSYGGLLLLCLLKEKFKLGKRIVVCDAPVKGVKFLKPVARFKTLVEVLLATNQKLPARLGKWMTKVGTLLTIKSWSDIDDALVKDILGADAHTAAILLKQISFCNLLDQISHVRHPQVLVVRGGQDLIANQRATQLLVEQLGALFHEFQGISHVPMQECPDQFNVIVDNFLTDGPKGLQT